MVRCAKKRFLTDEQKKLLEDNIGLVWWYVKRIVDKKWIRPDEIDEMSGYILWQFSIAACAYDQALGVKFSSFVRTSFDFGIKDYFRERQKFYGKHILTNFEYDGQDGDVILRDPMAPPPKIYIDKKELDNLLNQSNLTPFEEQVIFYYYNFDYAYTKIGQMIGYSRERIRQMHISGLNKIRKYAIKQDVSMNDFLCEAV